MQDEQERIWGYAYEEGAVIAPSRSSGQPTISYVTPQLRLAVQVAEAERAHAVRTPR